LDDKPSGTTALEEERMAKYLAVYIGTASAAAMAEQPTSPATEEAGMKAWGEWATQHKASIIDPGTPLGRTKRVSNAGVEDTKNQLTGYTIVEAGSLAEAAEMFKSHPHFTVFPGDSVEVVECLEMPR
jgi:hypothetical protein